MPGDLEDFLKRAAERRAQKQGGAAGGQKPKQQSRPRSEYTDARRERQVRQPVEEAIPVAEVVEPVNPLAEKQKRLAAAKAKAEAAKKKLEASKKSAAKKESSGTPQPPVALQGSGTPAEQLLQMLRQPGGIQQAFLLREILERPADRW
ncbi:MAG: hypothetical protein AAF802_16305 [Planctomycetota bacterium]